MIIAEPKDTFRCEPPGEDRKPEDKRVAYILRVPRVHDRAAIRRAASARGARQWGRLDLARQVRAEAAEVLAESDAETRARVLAACDTGIAAIEAFAEQILSGAFEFDTEDGRRAWIEAAEACDQKVAPMIPIQEEIFALGGRYAGMAADNEVFPQILGIEAARLLLVGWRNRKGKIARAGFKGVSEDTLASIPADHLQTIGARYLEAERPTEREAKNSASPSAGASEAPTSRAARTAPRKARS